MKNLIYTIKTNDKQTNFGLAIVTTIIIPFLGMVIYEIANGAHIYL